MNPGDELVVVLVPRPTRTKVMFNTSWRKSSIKFAKHFRIILKCPFRKQFYTFASYSSRHSEKTGKMSSSAAPSEARVTLQDVLEAHTRIKDSIHKTPVIRSATLNEMSGRLLYFKCENLQKAGAFKFRGALNAVIKVVEASPKDHPPTVVTHSSGNHAQALALAAKLNNIKAVIAMPSTAPRIKKSAVIEYGATVVDCGPSQEDRESTATRLLQEYGPHSFLVPPYDHPDIIAGQGTMAVELLEQVPDLDAIIVPVGGGGMLSGVCVAAKEIKPTIKIYAAEPLNANDCARSLAAGQRIPLTGPPNTIADGLKTSLGLITWPIIRDNVTDVITVKEEEIIAAMRLVWERMKLIIEPSAAVGVAAALTGKFKSLPQTDLKKVAVIFCGGNVDLESLPWLK